VKILASGVLGRSRFYSALLEYLLDCGDRGHAPKEIEIAAEVFNRGEEFDPSQDSMVRVYAHNLRQKLQQYYADQGSAEPDQIMIPKGEYRITLSSGPLPPPPPVQDMRRSAHGLRLALVVAVSVAAGFLLDRILSHGETPSSRAYEEVARSALWSAVTDDDLPVTVVVGDYYIFGERNEYGNVWRMVREFDINSSRDLDERRQLDPESPDYIDLDLTYHASSAAPAMLDLFRVLAAADKNVRVVSTSELDTAAIRESHIVYVGYLSGLGMLSDFAFGGSELAIGDTYDEIVHLKTDTRFFSEAGLPNGQSSYRDYGLFSTLPGPGGNQLVFVAGTRDEGLMQTADAVSNPALVEASLEAIAAVGGGAPAAYELLYEVEGLDRTNLDAEIVHSAALTQRTTVGHLTP